MKKSWPWAPVCTPLRFASVGHGTGGLGGSNTSTEAEEMGRLEPGGEET